MRLSVLCLALCMGVTVYARPEGEASPVATPDSPAAENTAADPKPAEEVAEEESVRPKRWHPSNPYYPYGSPNNYHNYQNFDSFPSGSFGTPSFSSGPTGRTRSSPGSNQSPTATFNELLQYQNQNDQYAWPQQQQQWQGNQQFRQPNLPDVIDTGAHGNFNNNNFHNQGFDSPVQSRTRFPPQMRTSPARSPASFAPPLPGFQGPWSNVNYNTYYNPYNY